MFSGVFHAQRFGIFIPALAEKIEELRLLARRERQTLVKSGAVIAAVFKAAGAFAALDCDRVALRAIGTEKAVPQAVKPVRREVRGEELIAVFFIVQFVFDDAVHIPAPGGVQAHLEILVVHCYMVEAEFGIRKHRKMPLTSAVVSQRHVPQLHGIVHRHEERLLRVDAVIIAQIPDVAQPVTAGVGRLIASDRLPGDGPVFAGVVVAQINIVSRPVHRHAVGTEADHAVILRRATHEPSGGVVENAVKIVLPDIVCPGYRQVYPVDDVFALLVVKMPVLHGDPLPCFITSTSIRALSGNGKNRKCTFLPLVAQKGLRSVTIII